VFENLSHQQLNNMTSDEYKQNFEGPNGDAFRARINELENGPRPAATRPAGNVRGDAPASTPGMTSFDPSFDNDPNDGRSSAAPAAAAPARGVRGRVEQQPAAAPAPAAKPGALSIWRYQPKDKEGNPVGSEQIFKYDPNLPVDHPQSLASQLTKAHSYATTALKAKQMQAVLDSVKAAETGYKEPTLLTVDQHPDADRLNAITMTAMTNAVDSAMSVFKQNHPEFPRGEANAAAIVKWVEKSKRNPADAQTWELAWQALKPYLLVASEVAAIAPAPVVEQPVVEQPAPVRVANGVPSGLSEADVFNEELVEVAPKIQGAKLVVDGKVQVMTLQAYERLASDVQRRILKNQSNASAIDALYNAEVERRKGGRR